MRVWDLGSYGNMLHVKHCGLGLKVMVSVKGFTELWSLDLRLVLGLGFRISLAT